MKSPYFISGILNRNSHNPLGLWLFSNKKRLYWDNPESLTVFSAQILMVIG